MRRLGAIPSSSDEGPKATLRALQAAGEHLEQGELVCVFAEGQLTRTGVLLPFRRGLERSGIDVDWQMLHSERSRYCLDVTTSPSGSPL